MVGGIVETVTPDVYVDGQSCMRVVVMGTGCEKGSVSAIRVADTMAAHLILPGDSLWWQQDRAYWTPQVKPIVLDIERNDDIPLEKLGYSFNPLWESRKKVE